MTHFTHQLIIPVLLCLQMSHSFRHMPSELSFVWLSRTTTTTSGLLIAWTEYPKSDFSLLYLFPGWIYSWQIFCECSNIEINISARHRSNFEDRFYYRNFSPICENSWKFSRLCLVFVLVHSSLMSFCFAEQDLSKFFKNAGYSLVEFVPDTARFPVPVQRSLSVNVCVWHWWSRSKANEVRRWRYLHTWHFRLELTGRRHFSSLYWWLTTAAQHLQPGTSDVPE